MYTATANPHTVFIVGAEFELCDSDVVLNMGSKTNIKIFGYTGATCKFKLNVLFSAVVIFVGG